MAAVVVALTISVDANQWVLPVEPITKPRNR